MPKQIMVATTHQGVFAGTVPTNQNLGADPITLTDCRLADRWGTNDDVNKLATDGPGPNARISVPATVTIRDIVAVWAVTPESWAKWQSGTWRPLRD